jgi:GNAT superfamily N-acetyltransferase
MTLPSANDLYAVTEATWPPARAFDAGPWVVRDGQGGGNRVSAATAKGPISRDDIARLEAEMAALDQGPQVMIRAGEAELDAALEAAGYSIADAVVLYAAPVAALAHPPPPISAYAHWPRLAAVEEIWARGGIGPGRLKVMDRAPVPKAAIIGRTDDSPAGAAYVGVHGQIAMIHAIEVAEAARRKGTARNMIAAAACWARDAGATTFSLIVTARNTSARALYLSLGMQVVGNYHYRRK